MIPRERLSPFRHILGILIPPLPLIFFIDFNAWADERLRFDWPVSCEINSTCFIQNYVDEDASPGVQDFSCGAATYDGHKGTDIRLISIKEVEKSIPVLAAAAGTIKALRDGVPDQLLRETAPEALAHKECGNGVVIDHGDNWETQYCHLRQGSIRVQLGEHIEKGQPLGLVGYSGMADFAHLHFEVRHQGKVLDPFLPHDHQNECSVNSYSSSADSLWTTSSERLAGSLKGQIIETLFSGTIPDLPRIEYGETLTSPTAESPQLIFVGRMINLRRGDILRLQLSGPSNFNGVTEEKPIDKNKATYIVYSGRKLKEARWPSGTYKGTLQVLRDQKIITEKTNEIHLH